MDLVQDSILEQLEGDQFAIIVTECLRRLEDHQGDQAIDRAWLHGQYLLKQQLLYSIAKANTPEATHIEARLIARFRL